MRMGIFLKGGGDTDIEHAGLWLVWCICIKDEPDFFFSKTATIV